MATTDPRDLIQPDLGKWTYDQVLATTQLAPWQLQRLMKLTEAVPPAAPRMLGSSGVAIGGSGASSAHRWPSACVSSRPRSPSSSSQPISCPVTAGHWTGSADRSPVRRNPTSVSSVSDGFLNSSGEGGEVPVPEGEVVVIEERGIVDAPQAAVNVTSVASNRARATPP